MDEEKAKQLRPKLAALRSFIFNVGLSGEYLPDNQTRSNYREMYADIKATLDDPNLEIYAPGIPHFGTTGSDSKLWADHQTRIMDSGTRLVKYLEALLEQYPSGKSISSKKLKCFLSFRFSHDGKKYGEEVKKFLETIDVEVVSGDKYEPRRISEKVRDLLSQGHDFGVLIVSSDGESMWTRDETNWIWSEGKRVIVIVEEGSKFEHGLQGDLEWIPFNKSHVSDAFTKLVQGIRFIENERR